MDDRGGKMDDKEALRMTGRKVDFVVEEKHEVTERSFAALRMTTPSCHPERSEGSMAHIHPADLTHVALSIYGESPGKKLRSSHNLPPAEANTRERGVCWGHPRPRQGGLAPCTPDLLPDVSPRFICRCAARPLAPSGPGSKKRVGEAAQPPPSACPASQT